MVEARNNSPQILIMTIIFNRFISSSRNSRPLGNYKYLSPVVQDEWVRRRQEMVEGVTKEKGCSISEKQTFHEITRMSRFTMTTIYTF